MKQHPLLTSNLCAFHHLLWSDESHTSNSMLEFPVPELCEKAIALVFFWSTRDIHKQKWALDRFFLIFTQGQFWGFFSIAFREKKVGGNTDMRETLIGCLLIRALTRNQTHTTWVCALTRNQTVELLVHGTILQPTEPLQSGLDLFLI